MDDFDYEKTMENPAIWKLISELVRIANKACKPLEVCGEMANNPIFIPKLIKSGITIVSTSPRIIANVRKAADTYKYMLDKKQEDVFDLGLKLNLSEPDNEVQFKYKKSMSLRIS